MTIACSATAHWIRITLVTLALLVPCGPVLNAQTATGQVHGSVVDPVGAAVADADIVLRNSGTGIESSLQSDERGFFAFRNLQPGFYTLEVAAAGFKTSAVPRVSDRSQPDSDPGQSPLRSGS